METQKICPRCKRTLSLESFHKCSGTLNNTNTDCKECHKAYNASWYATNKERCRARQKEYRIKNHDKIRAIEKRSFEKNKEHRNRQMKKYISRLKDHVFNMYGNKCACCGETAREFFAIDHIHGGGTKERQRLGTRGILIAASKDGFKKEKYQLLCHNCNMSLGFFGYCPHRPEIRRPYHKTYTKKSPAPTSFSSGPSTPSAS